MGNCQKEKAQQSFKKRIEAEIQEFSQKKDLEFEFAVLREKNKVIDDLYNQAAKEISSEHLKKLISSIFPKDVEGRVSKNAFRTRSDILEYPPIQRSSRLAPDTNA